MIALILMIMRMLHANDDTSMLQTACNLRNGSVVTEMQQLLQNYY